MRKLLLGLALVLAYWQSNAAVLPPEKLLPKETVAVYTLVDAAKSWSTFTNSSFGKLMEDPSLKAFEDKLCAKLNSEVFDPVEKQLGIKLADYKGLVQGQLTLALIQKSPAAGSNDYAAVCFFDAKDQAAKVKTLLADAQKKWTDSGKKVKKETIRGTEFATFIINKGDVTNALAKLMPNKKSEDEDEDEDSSKAKPVEITVGVADTLFIVGESTDGIEKILTRQSGGLIPSLDEEPLFQTDYAAHLRDMPGYFWVNINSFVTTFNKVAPSPEHPSPFDPKKIINSLGIGDLKTIGFTWKEASEGYMTQFFVDVPEASRKGLFKLASFERKDSNPPPFVPADAVEFFRWRVDLPGFWTTLEAIIVDVYPMAKPGIDTMFEAAGKDKDEKYDLKAELMGSLGNDIIYYKKSPKGVTLPELSAQPTLFLIGSAKADKLASAIKVSFESFGSGSGGTVKEKDFLGRKLYTFGTAEGGDNVTNGVFFAASGGYVAISSQLPILEEYLRSSDSKGKPLSETPGLADAAQKVGGMNTGLFGYDNQREQMRVAYEMIRQNGNTLLSGFGVKVENDPSKKAGLSEWLDFSLLPAYDAISKYFYISVYAASWDANGLTFSGYTPLSPDLKK